MDEPTYGLEEKIKNFLEYDSLANILKCSVTKCLKGNCKANRRPNLSCVAVNGEYVAFGWDLGFICIVRKTNSEVVGSVDLKKLRGTFNESVASTSPINVALRVGNRSMIIICICLGLPKVYNIVNSNVLSQDYCPYIYVLRAELRRGKEQLKFEPVLVKSPHHNPVCRSVYVSPSGHTFISGDSRGLIVCFKFSHQTLTYTNSVLTVVPGAVVDLKLSKSNILLITCRSLHESVIAPDVKVGELVHYLFTLNDKRLLHIDFDSILAPKSHLKLTVSCSSPSWLPGTESRFICSFKSTDFPLTSYQTTSPSLSTTALVFGVFLVENSQIHLLHLASFDKQSILEGKLSQISVLTSQISTLNRLFDKPCRTSQCQLSVNENKQSNQLSDTDDHAHDNGNSMRILDEILCNESGLHALSRNLFLFWTSSSSSDDNKSIFVIFKCAHRSDSSAHSVSSNDTITLLAYSTKLGDIRSVHPVWLKPIRPSFSEDRLLECPPPTGGFGGIGLEVWIRRYVNVGLDAQPLILLSTRPLCANRLAISPSVNMYRMFVESHSTSKISPTSPITRSASTIQSTLTLATLSSTSSPSPSSSSKSSFMSQAFKSNMSYQTYCRISESQLVNSQRSKGTTRYVRTMRQEGKMSATITLPTLRLYLPKFMRDKTIVEGIEIGEDAINLLGSLDSLDVTLHHGVISGASQVCSLSAEAINVKVETQTTDIGLDASQIDDPIFKECVSPSPQPILDRPIPDLDSSKSLLLEKAIQPNDDLVHHNSLVEHTTELSAYTNHWSKHLCPNLDNTAVSNDKLANLTDLQDYTITDCLEFVNFDGQPGFLLLHPRSGGHRWVLAPVSFGHVSAIHISPNRNLIWCQRAGSNKNNNSNQLKTSGCSHYSFRIDVYFGECGLMGLLSAWIQGRTGNWESGLLLNVTSVDLGNTHAVFTTVSGTIKLQSGLSAHRPYSSSHSWSCPDYHFFQVATNSSGMIWALGLDNSSNLNTNEEMWKNGRVVLLTTNLFNIHLSSGRCETVLNQLNMSKWSNALELPTMLNWALKHLLHKSNTLDYFIRWINAHLHLTLINSEFSMKTESHMVSGWIFLASDTIDTVSNTICSDFNGFLLCTKQDSQEIRQLTSWSQFTIGNPQNYHLNSNMLTNFFKRFTAEIPDNLTSIYCPKFHTLNFQITTHNKQDEPDIIFHSPLRLITQYRHNRSTVLLETTPYVIPNTAPPPLSPVKVVNSELITYNWRAQHYWTNLLGNVNKLYENYCLLEFHRMSTNRHETMQCLWTRDTQSNELACFTTSSAACFNPPMSDPNIGNGQITAICVVACPQSDQAHLLISLANGQLVMRSGLSFTKPYGNSQWFKFNTPDLWNDSTLRKTSSTAKPSMRSYFVSLVCVRNQLWSIDNLGYLYSSKLLSANQSDYDLSSWIWHSGSLDDGGNSSVNQCKRRIHFLSISGADWTGFGLGMSLWAVGVQADDNVNSKWISIPRSTSSRNSYESGQIYVRCSQSMNTGQNLSDPFYWMHVPSPSAKSVIVGNCNVWLLSDDKPAKVYYRVGLELLDSASSIHNHPAPQSHQIGFAWKLLPNLDPLNLFQLDLQQIIPTHHIGAPMVDKQLTVNCCDKSLLIPCKTDSGSGTQLFCLTNSLKLSFVIINDDKPVPEKAATDHTIVSLQQQQQRPFIVESDFTKLF